MTDQLTEVDMVPCFWIAWSGKRYVLKPDEVEGMKRSMDKAELAGYEIIEGKITADALQKQLVRRDMAIISNCI